MMDNEKILAHAKGYLEKLAEGRNPISGEPAQSGDIIKNERVSKCFKYVADVFSRVLDSGRASDEYIVLYKTPEIKNEENAVAVARGFIEKLSQGIDPVSGAQYGQSVLRNERAARCLLYTAEQLGKIRVTKQPFRIPEEALDGFEYSDEPIKLSEIKRRVDAMVDAEYMNDIKAEWVTSYLVSIQLLAEKESSDGKKRRVPTPMGRQLGITEEQREFQGHVSYTTLYSRRMQELIVRNIPMILEKYGKGS